MLNNDNDEKKYENFGDSFFKDARAAAPIAKAITERIYGKGCLNKNNRSRTNQPVDKRIQMKKWNKICKVLILVLIIAEVVAILLGKARIREDLLFMARFMIPLVIGYLYTKKKIDSN